jgi:hypothetical protein
MKMDISPTQKANIRKRLKAADDVVMKIEQSGVECNALVCFPTPISKSNRKNSAPFMKAATDQEIHGNWRGEKVYSDERENSLYSLNYLL